jgi:hypothetical protein
MSSLSLLSRPLSFHYPQRTKSVANSLDFPAFSIDDAPSKNRQWRESSPDRNKLIPRSEEIHRLGDGEGDQRRDSGLKALASQPASPRSKQKAPNVRVLDEELFDLFYPNRTSTVEDYSELEFDLNERYTPIEIAVPIAFHLPRRPPTLVFIEAPASSTPSSARPEDNRSVSASRTQKPPILHNISKKRLCAARANPRADHHKL